MADRDDQPTEIEIAHVLFMDLVGYSRLPLEDQDTWIDALQNIVRDSETFRTATEDGVVIAHPAGDGMALAFFRDPSMPVRCALEVADAAADAKLPLRMGVHTGPVYRAEDINATENVRGPAINLAQRVMDCGVAGSILLSYATADLLTPLREWSEKLREIGEVEMKHGIRVAVHALSDDAVATANDSEAATRPGLLARETGRRHNLPVYLTSFVGRETEVVDVRAQVLANRLTTLTGPGGTGKTRLSVEVTSPLVERLEDGVWMVDLAAIADPDLVATALAAALDVRDAGEQPLVDTLCRYLAGQTALLILDNCEHVIDAASALIDTLLQRCPSVTVLATSREPLGIMGEVVWAVRPLAVAPATDDAEAVDALDATEAARLFVERARAANPRLTLGDGQAAAVNDICRRLDGIPLAIELAAARLRVMSLAQIHDRVDERLRLLTGGGRASPARQQTLRALIDWSYRLLPEHQQELFCRLSVFQGGFTLEAAEAVCAVGDDRAWDVLELTLDLANKSMIAVEEDGEHARYRMLETLREFGLDQLAALGVAEDARERHARYFARAAQGAQPLLDGPDVVATLARLDAEHDNVRLCLGWGLEHDGALGIRILDHLSAFWWERGHWREFRSWCERYIAGATNASTALRSTAMGYLTMQMVFDPDVAAARRIGDAAVQLAREAGSDVVLVDVLVQRSWVEIAHSEKAAAARPFTEEAVRLWRTLPDTGRTALGALHTEAYRRQRAGDQEGSWALHEEVLAHARCRGNLRQQSITLACMCQIATDSGSAATAAELLDEAWEIQRVLGSPYVEALGLMSRGANAQRQGDYASMRTYLNMALPRTRRIGFVAFEANVLNHLVLCAWMLGDVPGARSSLLAALDAHPARHTRYLNEVRPGAVLAACDLRERDLHMAKHVLWQELVTTRDRDPAPALLACVDGHGWLAVACGQTAAGVQLLAYTAATRAGSGSMVEVDGDPLGIVTRNEHERYVGLARGDLGSDEFEAAWDAGSTMCIDEAIAFIETHADEWIA